LKKLKKKEEFKNISMKEMRERCKPRWYDMDAKEITVDEWEDLYSSNKRTIASENIGDYWISTILLGLDHSFTPIMKPEIKSRPVIFETMVFGIVIEEEIKDIDYSGIYQERFCTKEEALEGHQRICEEVRQGRIT